MLYYAPHGPTYNCAKSFTPKLFISRRNNEANVVGHSVYFPKICRAQNKKEFISLLIKNSYLSYSHPANIKWNLSD